MSINENTGSPYYPLFSHMSQEHGLTLTDSELADICTVAERMRGDGWIDVRDRLPVYEWPETRVLILKATTGFVEIGYHSGFTDCHTWRYSDHAPMYNVAAWMNLPDGNGFLDNLAAQTDELAAEITQDNTERLREEAANPATPADLFAGPMQTAMVFAARYTHSRNTGGTLAVVRSLEQCWHSLDEHTREQILRESHDAQYNQDDWQRLRDYASKNDLAHSQKGRERGPDNTQD